METREYRIAMVSVHSSPIGRLGTKDTGGMSVYIRELAREFGRRGHAVDIFTRSQDPQSREIVEISPGVRVIHLKAGPREPLNPLAIFPHLPDFLRALHHFKAVHRLHYHLIHGHYWLSGRVGNWAAADWKVPHLFMFHTVGALKNLNCEGEKEPDLRVRVEKQVARDSDRIIAATEVERSELVKHYGVPASKIDVVPCGVDLDLFRPLNKRESRLALGLGAEPFIVLFVGRFAQLKRIDRIIHSLVQLKHLDSVQLVIVGGDGNGAPEEANLHRLCRELNLQDRVTFVGGVEQRTLPVYYSAADVLVLPSEYESFGLVGLEALACGLPVVATPVGAYSTILRENLTGHLLADGTADSIARGIERFLTGGTASRSPAEVIRSSVEAYSWSHVAAAVLQEYASAVDHHRGAWSSMRGAEALAL